MAGTGSHQRRQQANRKVDEVYVWLKKRIMLSAIAAGHPLVELELAAEKGCSQGTIREALLRLREDGLIVRRGYRGTFVSPITATEAQAFLDLRARLETLGVRHSVSNIRSEHLAELSALVERMEEAAQADDEYRLFEQDQLFHVTLFQLADLPALVPVLIRCSLYNHRYKIAHAPTRRALIDTARGHWNILQALESKDAARGERVLRQHIQSVAGDDLAAPLVRVLAMSPAMEAVHRRVQAEDRALPDITTLPADRAREQFDQINARWNRIREEDYGIQRFTIPSPSSRRVESDDINALCITHTARHETSAGSILYLHGGGWVLGGNQTHLGIMAQLAEFTKCAVIGIDYRLAPEAPFPAGLNDCAWAWRWLQARETDPTPWYVAGDGAGANLALVMMMDLRNTGERLPDAALLFYGIYSPDHTTLSRSQCGGGQFGLTSKLVDWWRGLYLSGLRRDVQDPRVSPVLGDLSGLPPLLVVAAELDPLRDDSAQLAQRLAESGTAFEFKRYQGVNHGFMQVGTELPEATLALEDAAVFLKTRYTGGLTDSQHHGPRRR